MPKDVLFAGYLHDGESGLYHVRNRALHPGLGRWLQRDPAGYVDGMSVYEYVRGAPTNFADPLGRFLVGCSPVGPKPRDAGTCCNAAKAAGLDAGAVGGVICCDGKKIACAWVNHPGTTGGDFGTDLAIECINEHEFDHFDDVPACPTGVPSLSRPAWKPGANRIAEECSAYRIGFKCLDEKRRACRTKFPNQPDMQDCLTEVMKYYNASLDFLWTYCGGP